MDNPEDVLDSKADRIFLNSGLDYEYDGNNTYMFRDPEYPKCNFYATKGTWCLCGKSKVVGQGIGPEAFIVWYKIQCITGDSQANGGDLVQPPPLVHGRTDDLLEIANRILAKVLELKQMIEERE